MSQINTMMKLLKQSFICCIVLMAYFMSCTASAVQPSKNTTMNFLQKQSLNWINKTPEVYPCETLHEEGLKGIFYDGINGTRVFAWLGIPENASAEGQVPGIVLVHGGLGTAYARWARYWLQQGYAVIAMDNCGAMPFAEGQDTSGGYPRHQWSGASGWGAFDQYDKAPEEQWFTHAVSAVMLAHNLLRSLPEVDSDRIGITGISWGAVLTLISTGIDHRYKAACAVYGSGFMWESELNTQFQELKEKSPKGFDWWIHEWDPANFLDRIQCPVLWFASTNDKTIFYPTEWAKSVSIVSDSEVCLKIRWPHCHGKDSEEQPEIRSFFRLHLEGGERRLRLSKPVVQGDVMTSSVSNGEPMSALVAFTCDTNSNWHKRTWQILPAKYANGKISARLPKGWKAAYLMAISNDLQEFTSTIHFAE